MDRKPFFDHVRGSLFGGSLSPQQVLGMSAILDEWDKRGLSDVRFLAYMLATVLLECGAGMWPISEYGGGSTRYAPYYGRGFVQLTWQANYLKAGKAVGVDLVASPERALELPIATAILFDGMLEGWFTNKRLSDYIHGAVCDYDGARRIINGTDKAATVAGYAARFELAIRSALTTLDGVPIGPPLPAPKPRPPMTPVQRGAVDAGAVVIAGTAGAIQQGVSMSIIVPIVVVLLVLGGLAYAFRAKIMAKLSQVMPPPTTPPVKK